ncbi:conserved Plasmodium protein, unknown function [Plasmodium ovale]|uniref:Uncharacterized protein n=1 Tax=Plasmodium ovale TaxID=36330 RepID=A0A1D3U8V2_PLAOA|nr:conserved Plasmodium protein, unknown function [Plasmodium ovale]
MLRLSAVFHRSAERHCYRYFATGSSGKPSVTKKKKKLSSKTAKYINFFFLRKKQREERIRFNHVRRKKVKEVPSAFHVVCHLKNEKLQFLHRYPVSKEYPILENLHEENEVGERYEEKNSLALVSERHKRKPLEVFPYEACPNGEDERDTGGIIIHSDNFRKGENKEKTLFKRVEEDGLFFPCLNIKEDKRSKELKSLNSVNSVIDIRKNKDMCMLYLITSLINIYHDNNYYYLILKMMRDVKYMLQYMNGKHISMIIYNIYRHCLIQYTRSLFAKDNPENANAYFDLMYIIDYHPFVHDKEDKIKYITVDTHLVRNFLISLSCHLKKHLYDEKDINILSSILFVFSFFSVNDIKLNSLLIDRIFKSIHIKRNQKIKYFSLISLSFVKLKLFYAKFFFLHSYIITKNMNKMIKKWEKLLTKKKKKKKKKKLSQINLFDMHKRKKKFTLINLKDILTYFHIIEKNKLKNDNFVRLLLKYGHLFFRKKVIHEQDIYAYSYAGSYSVVGCTHDVEEDLTKASLYRHSMRNVSTTSKSTGDAEALWRKKHLLSYGSVVQKRGKNKKINKYLAIYSLYRINKSFQRREDGRGGYLTGRMPDCMLDRGVDIFSITMLLSQLVSYDHLCLKRIAAFNHLVKLYIDIVRSTDLRNVHFFYTYKIVQINRWANIYNNFLTKLVHSSLHYKCKQVTLFSIGSIVQTFYAESLSYYLVRLLEELVKGKIRDYKLNNAIFAHLVQFFKYREKASISQALLHRCVKLLSLLKDGYSAVETSYAETPAEGSMSLYRNFHFLVFQSLGRINWNSVDNVHLLKFYKYMDKLRWRCCHRDVHVVWEQVRLKIKERVHLFNLPELMKLYLHSSDTSKRTTFHINYLFDCILSSSRRLIGGKGDTDVGIADVDVDGDVFISFFKTTFTHLYLWETREKTFFIRNFNPIAVKLIDVYKKYILRNVERLKRKYLYVIIMYSFFYLSVLLRRRKKMNVQNGGRAIRKGIRDIGRIAPDIFHIMNTTLQQWIFGNDEKSHLVYIFLIYFHIVNRGRKGNVLFKEEHSKKFMEDISKRCIKRMNHVYMSHFSYSTLTYINPLILFFLFKYDIFLKYYNSRKKKKKMEKILNSVIIYRHLLNTKKDRNFLEIIFYTITKNNSILHNDPFDDFTHLYFNKMTYKQCTPTVVEKLPKRRKLYNDMLEWTTLVNTLHEKEDNNSVSILYNFIARRRVVESAIRVALNRSRPEMRAW